MANLSDTLVNGDLRVVGNIYGTVTSALSAGSTSITTGSTAGITLSAGQKFTLAAGGSTAAFTMPSAPTAVAYASSAGSATKLTASRNIITNLGSTAAASFNGTADISAGIFGTLPVKYGGTGATAAADARTNLGITPANIGAATTTHTHGNILSGGTITADTTIANGAKIAFIDTNNKVSRGAAAFDASTTTKALTQKGTFETFSKLTLGSGSDNAASGTHTHTTSIASGSTAGITLTAGKSFTLSAGGTTTAFTMPSAPTAVAYASSAGSATKLTSSRNIITNLGSTAAASFNGTADISAGVTGTLPVSRGGTGATAASAALANLGAASADHGHTYLDNRCNIKGNNTSVWPWRRIAGTNDITANYVDSEAILLIHHKYDNGAFGILKIGQRVNNQSTSADATARAQWLVCYGIDTSNYIVATYKAAKKTYTDIFAKATTYPRASITCLAASTNWNFYTSDEGSNSASHSNAYSSIAAAGTEIHNQAYTTTAYSTVVGVVSNATKLGTVDVGSATVPIYLSAGTPKQGSTYAGGTSLTLNGTSKAAATASIYAPTASGTSGYILKSNGANSAPTWIAQNTISAGYASSASKIGSVTVGNSNQPIYLNGGAPSAANAYAGGTSLTLNGTSKSAATASIYAPTATGTAGYILKSNGANSAPTWIAQSALNGSNVGSSSCPVYINAAGQPTQISHYMQLQPANSSGGYDAYIEVRASGDNVCADIDAVYITGANDSRVGVWVKPSANKGTWAVYMNKDMTLHFVGDELKKMAYDSANSSGYFEGYVTWSPTIKKMVVGTLSTDPNTISFA